MRPAVGFCGGGGTFKKVEEPSRRYLVACDLTKVEGPKVWQVSPSQIGDHSRQTQFAQRWEVSVEDCTLNNEGFGPGGGKFEFLEERGGGAGTFGESEEVVRGPM